MTLDFQESFFLSVFGNHIKKRDIIKQLLINFVNSYNKKSI